LVSNDMTNKRQHKRVTIKSIGDIVCVDDQRRFTAFVGGISRGGLEIYTPERMNPSSRLKIALSFLDKDGKLTVENLSGQVRWSAPFKDAYIAGIQFDVLVDRESTPALIEYIENAERYFV
ncbi:MAG: PilZ domain-containing protein, partial [Nitrospirae bacterium]|nr:PilZ domain-containing protein [Nitrospirota bacterium]